MEKYEVAITINSKLYKQAVSADTTLLDFIRDINGFTGTKKSCEMGDCGACSVIMDGKLVNSCIILAVEANNSSILTIEGISEKDTLHPIQQAFIEEGAIQCGYCTPGMILAVKALLDKNPNPTQEQIRAGISGNLCRCTGYNKIVSAASRAAKMIYG